MGSATAGLSTGLQIGASAAFGGVVSELSGGNFWKGAAQAGIIAGFNHAAHRVLDGSGPRGGSPKRLNHEERMALKMRIQSDGIITLGEAGQWYRQGDGTSLEINASAVSTGSFTNKDFPDGVGSITGRNTIFRSNGRVYGNLLFRLLENNRVQILPDRYDFEMRQPWQNNIFRNITTMMRQSYSGSLGGHAYDINFNGTIPLH